MLIREYQPSIIRNKIRTRGNFFGKCFSIVVLVIVTPILLVTVFIGLVISGIVGIVTAPFRKFRSGWFDDWFKRIFLDKYQKYMWQANIAQSEISKPMRFYSEAIQTATFLAVIGLNVAIYYWVGIYIVGFILAIMIGGWLLKKGVVKYLTKMGNEHNPEMMEIKKGIEEIKEKLNGSNTNKV